MPTQRAVLFANGLINDLEAARGLLHPADFLIAVDGGARHLMIMGILPDVLIGDLDSLTSNEVDALIDAGVTVQRYPVDKDQTDLELAIQLACSQGATSLVIVGALGGRFDQSLANLFLLALPLLADRNARLDDGSEAVFLIQKNAIIHGQPGDTLSLLPLGGPAREISTSGLRFPLSGETLYPEHSRGVSNQLLANTAEINLSEGTLICVHTRKKEN